MILFKKTGIIFLLFAASFFSGCGKDIGGNSTKITSDGLSPNYYLKNLSFSAGELQYPFIPNDWLNYLEVPFTTDSITLTVEQGHIWQEISIADEILNSGEPSNPIDLHIGLNTIYISIVAENGSQLIYTIHVTRCTENYFTAKLSQLSIDGLNLNPVFNISSHIRDYIAITKEATIALTAESFASDEGATNEVFINNTHVSNNNSIDLESGTNTITIITTAPNGKNKETYKITIIRQSETGSERLAYLSIAGGGFITSFENNSPVLFDPDIDEYWINVSSTMNPVNLTAIAESANKTPQIELDKTPMEDPSSIALPPGTVSIISVIIGSTTYKINANSLQGSDNAFLENITVKMGEKSYRPVYPGTPANHDPKKTVFSGNIFDYTTVIYGFKSIEVTATAEDSSIKGMDFIIYNDDDPEGSPASSSLVNGEGKANIDLIPGKTTRIEITVTAGDATTTKKYILYARLLNVDEFYWGIYSPSFSESKERWKKPSLPGQSFPTNGIIQGKSEWSTGPLNNLYSQIKITNYNDGQQGFMYNDGGFIANGTQYTKLDGATSKNGLNITMDPPFEIKTKEGETIATLNYHLQVRGGDPRELKDSYTEITYMPGTDVEVTIKQDYREFSTPPYPFTNNEWFNENYTAPQLWQ